MLKMFAELQTGDMIQPGNYVLTVDRVEQGICGTVYVYFKKSVHPPNGEVEVLGTIPDCKSDDDDGLWGD